MTEATSPLIIADSAAVALRLRSIVGLDYEVCSTNGQICDLPRSELGINPETCHMTFLLTGNGRAALKKIRPLLPENRMVYLATETSDAGEALASQLVSRLRLKHYRRIHLTDLTPQGILTALSLPRPINFSRVYAHNARRAIDRLIGFTVSRPMGHMLGRKGVPTGRLQAAILSALISHDKQLPSPPLPCRRLAFESAAGNWSATFVPKDPAAAESENHSLYSVLRFTSRTIARMPPPPLTLSALLLSAARRWGYRPDKVWDALHALYCSGTITRPLSCSPNFSQATVVEMSVLDLSVPFAKNGNRYPAPPLRSSDDDEALRPTDFSEKNRGTSQIQQDLYAFIWARAALSQLTPATYSSQTLTLVDESGNVFTAQARQLQDPGFLLFANIIDESLDDDTDAAASSSESPRIPEFSKGYLLKPVKSYAEYSEQARPARYTISDIIIDIETKKLGDAQAVLQVLESMLQRGLFKEEKGLCKVTDLGEAIHDLLTQQFSYTSIEYMQKTEAALQNVGLGRLQASELVRDFWDLLAKEFALFQQQRVSPLPHDGSVRSCPKCGRTMGYTTGPHGPFWACSGFTLDPGCDYTST